MLKQYLVTAVAIAAMASLGAVAKVYGQEDAKTKVLYSGDDAARNVCVSIVYDDLDGLRRAFRVGRSYPLERSHLAYECNNMPLDDFALSQNAMQVSGYLALKFGRSGTVTIEQVGSTVK